MTGLKCFNSYGLSHSKVGARENKKLRPGAFPDKGFEWLLACQEGIGIAP